MDARNILRLTKASTQPRMFLLPWSGLIFSLVSWELHCPLSQSPVHALGPWSEVGVVKFIKVSHFIDKKINWQKKQELPYFALFLQLSNPEPSFPPQILQPFWHLSRQLVSSSPTLQNLHPSFIKVIKVFSQLLNLRFYFTCVLDVHSLHLAQPLHSGSVLQYLHLSQILSRRLPCFFWALAVNTMSVRKTPASNISLFIL